MYECNNCKAPYKVKPNPERCSRCCRLFCIVQTAVDVREVVQSRRAPRLRAVNNQDDQDADDDQDEEEDEGGPVSLDDVDDTDSAHIPTKIAALDKLLGGGVVPGAVILLAGDPGAGKTTFALSLVKYLKGTTYYASAEQQESRIKITAKRLKINLKAIKVWRTRSLNAVIEAELDFEPTIMVIDSLQAFVCNDVRGGAGSTMQTAAIMERVTDYTQEHNLVTIVVSRLNKKGQTHGANAIEHDGDLTAFLRLRGLNEQDPRRILHITKNRDGPAPGSIECSMGPQGLVFT